MADHNSNWTSEVAVERYFKTKARERGNNGRKGPTAVLGD